LEWRYLTLTSILIPINSESDLNFGKSRFRATPDEMTGIAALINSKIIL
jgi:hypothetical protein